MAAENFGVAGLGVMGRNVALNIERNGFPVIAYNRGDDNARRMREEATGRAVQVTQSIPELVDLLDPPRRVLLMVTAGPGTDRVIDALVEHLAAGDVLIDGGNSHFPDTERRAKRLKAAGLHFVGCGISGGEEGALWGPSIMPGGDRDAYDPMAEAMQETRRRREAQMAYNTEHNITPATIEKAIQELIAESEAAYASKKKPAKPAAVPEDTKPENVQAIIADLTRQMHKAALDLDFEQAAALRDQIAELKTR